MQSDTMEEGRTEVSGPQGASSMAPSVLPTGALVAGRFEVQALADWGGMGAVYRAEDKHTGEHVALKVLLVQGGDERFAREARVLAELRHPRIVRYVAHGRTEAGALYLAMEWLDGIDLRRHLGIGPMSVSDAVDVTRGAAIALGVAHARGIVHRDINPRNLFLPGGRIADVKVLDFGIARPLMGTFGMTVPGVQLGTPGYMAPEQARGDSEVDARADVFALGCVLFECLVGRPAFVADNMMALLAKVLLEESPRLRKLGTFPAALDDLVARMLSKNPAARPAEAGQVALALAGLSGLDEAAPSVRVDAPPSLTHGEQRLVCVVMASPLAPGELLARDGSTLASPGIDVPGSASPSPIARFGARVERLLDGSIVATLASDGDATDHAAQAARFALALRDVMPEGPIVLATGRGVVTGRFPVGEVLDRASRLLLAAHAAHAAHEPTTTSDIAPLSKRGTGPIRIDEVTAGLLDLSFDIADDGAGVELRGARESSDAARTVLGRATSCVGRDRDLLTLEATYAECAGDSVARAVLVTSPAGLGKTRLRRELLRRLRRRAEPIEVLIGRADPMSAGAPFSMLARAISGASGIADGEPLEVRRQKLAVRVARHVAEGDRLRVTEFLGELVGAPFPDDESVQLRAARQDPMLRGDQMRRACEDWIRAECDAHPVVLVLEDLHWGDLPTVKVVDAMLRNLHDRPLMVLALARPDVHALFPNVWQQRGIFELALTELTRKASERLVREVLGDAVPEDRLKRMVDDAAGNPFCLEELIRAESEGKRGAVPETVIAVVHARLERLDPGARRVLRAASIFGQQFWRGAVLRLLGGERPSELKEWLDVLVEREVVIKKARGKFPTEDEYAFAHGLVREAAYAMLTGEDRALGHRLAAEWLEEAGERDALTLGGHFERGEVPSRAVGWYRRAAAQALEGNDLEAVVDLTERAIKLGADTEALGAVLLLQAEAHKWRGANVDAHAMAERAMASLEVGSAPWCAAAGEVAAACGKLGKRDELAAVAEKLGALPTGGAHNDARVIATARTVTQLALAGLIELAPPLLARIDSASGAGDPAVAAWVLEARAVRAGSAGDPGARVELADAAANSFELAGDLRNACLQRVSVGYAYVEIGAYLRAERALREALAVSERMGLDNATGVARAQLGRALAGRGVLDEARAVEASAVVALDAQKNRRLEGAARTYLARIFAAQGDLVAAEREARHSLEILGEAAPLRCAALAVLAEIQLVNAAAADALASAKDASQALAAAGTSATGEAHVRLVLAEAIHATGDLVAARDAIATARDRVLERAKTLTDAELRRGFLEDVAENARTLARALEWSDGSPP